jgi:hypothetical protein
VRHLFKLHYVCLNSVFYAAGLGFSLLDSKLSVGSSAQAHPAGVAVFRYNRYNVRLFSFKRAFMKLIQLIKYKTFAWILASAFREPRKAISRIKKESFNI